MARRLAWGPEGFGSRTLFDNFIGRKRDVDGGVLAGFFVSRGMGSPGRDKLTVTFQTDILLRVGWFERRETVGALIAFEGSVWNSSKGVARPLEVEEVSAKRLFDWMTGQ